MLNDHYSSYNMEKSLEETKIQDNENGKIKNQAMIHSGGKIQSLVFSKDFSILATAATDGCKIVDP